MAFGSAIPTTIAGYIAVNQGWRWVWWWLVILIGVGLGAFVFLYEETSYTRLVETTPTVSFQNEKQLDSEDTASSPKSHVIEVIEIEVIEIDESIPRRTYRQKLAFWTTNEMPVNDMLWISIEPFLMLYQFPIVIFVALLYGVMTACITVTATTNGNQLPLPPYNFNPSEIGLMNIPSFLGLVVAFVIYAPFADRSMLYFARRRGGIYEPESRLYPALLSILFIPAGLFLYGVSLDKGDHWTLPAAGIFLLSFGSAIPSAAALTYLTDSYTEVSQSLCPLTSANNSTDCRSCLCRRHLCPEHHLHGLYIHTTTLDRQDWPDMVLRRIRPHCHVCNDGNPPLHRLWQEIPCAQCSEVPSLCRTPSRRTLYVVTPLMNTKH